MAQRTKKQHVVPRFYLTRFCDADGMVWTYAAKIDAIARKPEATAIETNFYSPVVVGNERFDEIETLLARIEGDAAPLWEEVLAGKVMAGEGREKIALFLAAQYLRSPATIAAGAELAAYFMHHTAQFLVSSKEVHDKSVDDYEAETGKAISPEEREKIRDFLKDPKKYYINVLRAAGLPMLGSIGHLADTFNNMKWLIGRSNDQHLITSDSPVVRTSDPKTHGQIYGDGAFANKTVRVTFPLSPERILEMSWQGSERERVVEMPKKMAREMNGLRAANAERFLYANQKDGGIAKLCDKWLGRQRKQKIVAGVDTPKIVVKRKL
jgi:Protein of unknown function (DUF4238)